MRGYGNSALGRVWAVPGEGRCRTAVARGGAASATAENPPEDPPHRLPQSLAPRPGEGTGARASLHTASRGLGGRARCPSVARLTLPGHRHPGAGSTGGGQGRGTLGCRLCLPRSKAGRPGRQGQRRAAGPAGLGPLAPGRLCPASSCNQGPTSHPRGLVGSPGGPVVPKLGGGTVTRASPSVLTAPLPAPALGSPLRLRPPRAPASHQLPPQPPEALSPPLPTAHAAVQAR